MDPLERSQGSPEVHRPQFENHQQRTYTSPGVTQMFTYYYFSKVARNLLHFALSF